MPLLSQSPWLRRACIVLGVVVLALAAMPQIWNPFSRDHGELTACAQALLRGATLYRDCWENKGPLTYPFFMLPVAISPTIIAVRTFDVLWQALTALTLGRVITRMGDSSRIGGLAAMIYWALYMGSGFWNTLQSETFAALFIALCAYGMWRNTSRWLFVAGVCAGVFIWIKYTYALIALGMGLVMLWQCYRVSDKARVAKTSDVSETSDVYSNNKPQSSVPKSIALFIAGALTLSLLPLAYLLLSGAFPAFLRHLYFLQGPFAVHHDFNTAVDLAWLALRNYINDGSHIGPVAKPTVPIWNVAGFGFPILFVLAIYGLWQHRRTTANWYWAAAGLMGFVGIVWQGRYSSYHTMLLLLPLVAAASLALPCRPTPHAPQLTTDSSLATYLLTVTLIVALIGCLPGILDWQSNVIAQSKTPRQVYDDTSMHDELVLSDWLQEHSTPQDRIAIWGVAANVYFVSQRQNATSFNFLIPFEYDSAYRDLWMNQYVQEMTTNLPKYVVISKDDYPTPSASAQRALRAAAPIHAYIEAHYTYVGESTVFLLYERNK